MPLMAVPQRPVMMRSTFPHGPRMNPFGPSGPGYFDAFANKPSSAVVSAKTGPATIITGTSVDTIAGGPVVTAAQGTDVGAIAYSGNAVLILFNPGSSDGNVAQAFRVTQTATPGVATVSTTFYSCAQFNGALGPAIPYTQWELGHLDGDPAVSDTRPSRRVENIPLRGSLRIRNVTESLSVGGVVRVLRYSGGFQLNRDSTTALHGAEAMFDHHTDPADVGTFMEACNMVRDSPRTVSFTGHELRQMHQSNSYPSDFVRSMSFQSDTSLGETIRNPSFCTVMILVDDFASSNNLVNNTYEIQMVVHRAARFGPGTLLHSMAVPLKTLPDVHHRHGSEEERKPAAGAVASAAAHLVS